MVHGAVAQWCSGAVVQWCSAPPPLDGAQLHGAGHPRGHQLVHGLQGVRDRQVIDEPVGGVEVWWSSGVVVLWCSGAVVTTRAQRDQL